MSSESLLDQAKRMKTEREALRVAAAEKVASENKEAELPLLTEEFKALKTKRSAIAEIKEAAERSNPESLQEAKKTLRSERGVLREIHELSKDEETGEAALPSPSEIIRDENFVQAPEVARYNNARENFRLTATEIKKVRAELASLGIENPEDLLPGQLEVLLEDMDKEVAAETSAFILEHPEVDPEAAAEIRAALVQSKIAAYGHVKNALPKHFHANARAARGSVVEAVSKSLRDLSPQDMEMYMRVLKENLGSSVERVSVLDTEALANVLAAQMVDDPIYSTEARQSLPEIKEDNNETGAQYYAHRKTLVEKIATMPVVEQKAREIIEGYKKMSEYQKIPNEVDALTREKNALRSSVETQNVDSELTSIGFKENNGQSAIEIVDKKLEQMREGLLEIARTRATLGELADASMEGRTNTRFGGAPTLDITIKDADLNFDEINAKIPHPDHSEHGAKKKIEVLSRLTSRIRAEKDGFLGRTTTQKKQLLELLANEMQKQFGVDAPGGVEGAEAKIAELEKSIPVQLANRETMIKRMEEKLDTLKPLRDLAVLLNVGQFSGTVGDFAHTLQTKIPEQIGMLEASRVHEINEKNNRATVKEELMLQKTAVDTRISEIAQSVETLEASRAALENELTEKGFLSKPKTRGY
jgi:hypothetical protein